MDGGMVAYRSLLDEVSLILLTWKGTMVEDEFGANIKTSLWASRLLHENPELLKTAHSAFIASGSSLILSATCVEFIFPFPFCLSYSICVV